MDCLFCKIIKGEIPSKKIYEDELIFAFHDISPQAPIHFLVIPKKHIPSMLEIKEPDREIMGHLMAKIPEIANQLGLDSESIRMVNNCGSGAGQTVFHIHFHILAGRPFGWPPG